MEKMRARRWPIAAMILSGFSILLFPVHFLLKLIFKMPIQIENVIIHVPLFIGFLSCFIIVLFTRRNMRWLTLLPFLIIYGLEAWDQVNLLHYAQINAGEDLRSFVSYYLYGPNIRSAGLFYCMTMVFLFYLLLLITRKKVFAILTTVFLGFGIVAAIVYLAETPLSCWSYTPFFIAYILISFAVLRVYPKPRKA